MSTTRDIVRRFKVSISDLSRPRLVIAVVPLTRNGMTRYTARLQVLIALRGCDRSALFAMGHEFVGVSGGARKSSPLTPQATPRRYMSDVDRPSLFRWLDRFARAINILMRLNIAVLSRNPIQGDYIRSLSQVRNSMSFRLHDSHKCGVSPELHKTLFKCRWIMHRSCVRFGWRTETVHRDYSQLLLYSLLNLLLHYKLFL